ncbi:MAG: ABC transporter ATP-binding protein [Bdellovibrionaceae bacterium]|nr:ABC transporter ATP-binding protein [Pseudobdellovibrionaceae bacterium]
MKIISGIYQPNQGTVHVRGRLAPVLELGAGFADELSGYDNIFLNSSILGYSRAESLLKTDKIIEFSELGDQIHDAVRNYSSGMLVRLAFSIACHLDAQLLLFDEVMAVGDLGFQRKCMEKIGELNRAGASIVLVSHSPNQIASVCNRCLLIDNGHIIFDGSAQTGSEQYKELFI